MEKDAAHPWVQHCLCPPSIPSLLLPFCSAPLSCSVSVPHFWIIIFFGNGPSVCCGASNRAYGPFPSPVSSRAVPSCSFAVFQDPKGQEPCREDRPWCGDLLAYYVDNKEASWKTSVSRWQGLPPSPDLTDWSQKQSQWQLNIWMLGTGWCLFGGA